MGLQPIEDPDQELVEITKGGGNIAQRGIRRLLQELAIIPMDEEGAR
jgi:hypothetical protein